MLVSTGVIVKTTFSYMAHGAAHGILIKIGLTEVLSFICGFVFGSAQGFITGFLIITISNLLTGAVGLWTPFIGAIVGLIGIAGGHLRHLDEGSNIMFLVAAIALTLMSEVLQNAWFAWYMWSFYMPETSLLGVFITSLVMGIKSLITALINNMILFTVVAPRIIKVLREWVITEVSH
jgi:uncharacterized membrane protein